MDNTGNISEYDHSKQSNETIRMLNIDLFTFLEILNAIMKLKSKLLVMTTYQLTESYTNVFFNPLLILFNQSLKTSVYLEAFKTYIIYPIYKPGKKNVFPSDRLVRCFEFVY